MARKSRKNMMLQENTALPDKEKKVLFKAGLYARLSHETEENIERGTIETQMELMKNYVLFCKLNDAPVVTLNDAITV